MPLVPRPGDKLDRLDKSRMVPDVVEPEGPISEAAEPIAVRARVGWLRPELNVDVDGLAVAWAENAVLVQWESKPGEQLLWWLDPGRVTRIQS